MHKIIIFTVRRWEQELQGCFKMTIWLLKTPASSIAFHWSSEFLILIIYFDVAKISYMTPIVVIYLNSGKHSAIIAFFKCIFNAYFISHEHRLHYMFLIFVLMLRTTYIVVKAFTAGFRTGRYFWITWRWSWRISLRWRFAHRCGEQLHSRVHRGRNHLRANNLCRGLCGKKV